MAKKVAVIQKEEDIEEKKEKIKYGNPDKKEYEDKSYEELTKDGFVTYFKHNEKQILRRMHKGVLANPNERERKWVRDFEDKRVEPSKRTLENHEKEIHKQLVKKNKDYLKKRKRERVNRKHKYQVEYKLPIYKRNMLTEKLTYNMMVEMELERKPRETMARYKRRLFLFKRDHIALTNNEEAFEELEQELLRKARYSIKHKRNYNAKPFNKQPDIIVWSRNKKFDFLKYYRLVIFWATEKFLIEREDLEFLYYMYSDPPFTKKEFIIKAYLMGGYIGDFNNFIKKGFIQPSTKDLVEFEKLHESQKTYKLSLTAQGIVDSVYKKLLMIETIHYEPDFNLLGKNRSFKDRNMRSLLKRMWYDIEEIYNHKLKEHPEFVSKFLEHYNESSIYGVSKQTRRQSIDDIYDIYATAEEKAVYLKNLEEKERKKMIEEEEKRIAEPNLKRSQNFDF